MRKKICSLLFTIIISAVGLSAWAQDSATNKKVEMADAMRSNGKIYVVVAVLVTILAGLILYMFRLDRKISRLEKEESGK